MQKTLLTLAAVLLGALAIQAAPVKNVRLKNHKPRHELTQATKVRVLDTKTTRAGELTPIEEPAGTPTLYSETVDGFVSFWGMPVYSEGIYPGYVYLDGNDVYFKCPIPAAKVESYVKGTKADGKVSVPMPQMLGSFYDEDYDETIELYLNVVKLTVSEYTEYDEDSGEEYTELAYWYVNAPEVKEVTYIIDDNDGSLYLEIDGNSEDEESGLPLYMLALVYDLEEDSEDSWTMFGDISEYYEIFEGEATALPENLKPETWGLLFDGDARIVNVAFDGNDVYVGNLCPEFPDSYVKGSLANGEVTLPITYLGVSEEYGEFIFFTPAEWTTIYLEDLAPRHAADEDDDEYGDDEEEEEGYEDYVAAEVYRLSYDAESRRMSAIEENSAVFLTPPVEPEDMISDYLDYFYMPELVWQNPDTQNAKPENPEFLAYYDMRDWYDCDLIDFDLPKVNIYGNVLDTKDMYYVFYVDGEQFTFEPDFYVGLDEDMTEVPYDFYDDYNYDIYSQGTMHEISLYIYDVESVGVQLFYKGTDGETYASDLIEITIKDLIDLTEGVTETIGGKVVANVSYTSLNGVAVTNPVNGLYIKTTVYTDGSRRIQKVIVK